jgi:hypothetical protein
MKPHCLTALLVTTLGITLSACGSGSTTAGATGATSTAGSGGASGSGGAGGAGSTASAAAGSSTGSGGSGGSSPTPICMEPIQAADTSVVTTKVGSGPGTCTEQAFGDAVKKGGVITFDCGGAATIVVTSQKELPKDKDTVIDGGGLITIDGGGTTRILHFDGGDFRKTKTTVMLQHLTFKNAKSSGTMLPAAPAPCSKGTDTDGGGAAILIRDGVLHVVDVTFEDGKGPALGPDVAGGGVYGIGSLDITIVGSRFKNNSASNGGAVGSLFSNLTLVDDVFDQNKATGNGANYIDPACKVNGGESGDGGNGGAVVMDGGEDFGVTICGCSFTGNKAGALGGAVFRTPDGPRAATNIDRSTFDGNQAQSGGAMYFHHSDLTITATTASNNSAEGAGAIKADDTNLVLLNTTFTANSATKGLGGAIALFGNGGKIQSSTFSENHADGGSGLFGAALAGGSTFEIDNSIFANNSSKDCGAPMTCHVGADTGVSVIQWPMKHLVCSGDDPPCAGAAGTTFADPMLAALADNGGPTRTLLPPKASPAVGIGKACPATDQRGVPRKSDGCTAGAVEVE